MRKAYLACLLILLNHVSFAQTLRDHIAAPYIGVGAYSIHHADAFSFTANQAALAQIKIPAIGAYAEQRFLLHATNLYSGVFVIPTKDGNFGLQLDYFGFKDYNESQVGFAYARALGSKFDLGIKFNYFSFRIPSYISSSTINFEIGGIAHLSEKLHVGIDVYNPVGGRLSKTDNEKLSSVYKLGIGYEASENFILSAEIIKQENLPINVLAGMQYNFEKQFYVRVGVNSDNGSFYSGAGVSWKDIRLDFSVSYHPQLGLSPGVMLIVNLKSKKNE